MQTTEAMNHGVDKSSAIGKMCALLKAIAARPPQRLNELAAATGMNRTTAFRILEELAEAGMVEKKGAPPRYDFGPEIAAIGGASARCWDMQALARPSLLRLADATGDTIVLHARSQAESLCVDRVVGDFPIRANLLEVGSRRPLGVGAGSMAMLAVLPAAEQTAVLGITCAGLARFPRFSREKLLAFVEDFRTRGYVVMCDVIVEKMGAIAIPLLDRHGNCRAAISIAALTERILQREAELASLLRREAEIIRKS